MENHRRVVEKIQHIRSDFHKSMDKIDKKLDLLLDHCRKDCGRGP